MLTISDLYVVKPFADGVFRGPLQFRFSDGELNSSVFACTRVDHPYTSLFIPVHCVPIIQSVDYPSSSSNARLRTPWEAIIRSI